MTSPPLKGSRHPTRCVCFFPLGSNELAVPVTPPYKCDCHVICLSLRPFGNIFPLRTHTYTHFLLQGSMAAESKWITVVDHFRLKSNPVGAGVAVGAERAWVGFTGGLAAVCHLSLVRLHTTYSGFWSCQTRNSVLDWTDGGLLIKTSNTATTQ